MNSRFADLVDYYDKRIIMMRGGTGSGKSYASGQIIALALLQGRNQLVVRKVQKSLRHSVFSEVVKSITLMELSKYFKIKEQTMDIFCKTGAQAFFGGCIPDIDRLKSITPAKGIWNDIHIEEMTELSPGDFSIIEMRQRGDDPRPRRLFGRFNPIRQNHWIKKEIYDSGKYDFLDHHTTHLDNDFLSDEDHQRYEAYTDYYRDVYTLGNWGVLGGLIFDKYEIVDAMPSCVSGGMELYGLDFGYEHPAAALRIYLTDNDLYIDDEICERKLTNKELADLLLPFINDKIIICDSAEPKSIKELHTYGIRAIGAKKGAGSILSGIKFAKKHNIYINRRCVKTIAEFETYQRKLDRDGQPIEQPVDINNHCIDAMRYAIEQAAKGSYANFSTL